MLIVLQIYIMTCVIDRNTRVMLVCSCPVQLVHRTRVVKYVCNHRAYLLSKEVPKKA